MSSLAKYRYFVGDQWERFGERAWMGPWKLVYTRPTGARPDIVAELRGITDRDASLSVPMVLGVAQGAETARAALAAAYDDSAVTDLAVYNINIGDGAAMSGLIIAGRRAAAGEDTILVFWC